MSLDTKLDRVVARREELRAAMVSETQLDHEAYARAAKEYSELTPVAEAILGLRRKQAELKDLDALIADPKTEPEMKTMAQEERNALAQAIPPLESRVKLLLLPRDAADEKNAILEVRAGTGGDEAALFAAALFRMYERYAQGRRWKFEAIEQSPNEIGGLKEAIASIAGKGVFARLKFESGVHRVQRVPATEGSGRIHTSTATVAVLPEAEDVDVKIDEKDLRIDVFRSSGPGGQSVNTTDSAVRITHIPTGIVVQQQDEKSQHRNKAKALKVLRARLYEAERQKLDAQRAATRKGQVGSGDRSERIRTYNFPQGRVSDHRINLTLHKIDKVMEGEALDELIDALIAEDQAAKLAELE